MTRPPLAPEVGRDDTELFTSMRYDNKQEIIEEEFPSRNDISQLTEGGTRPRRTSCGPMTMEETLRENESMSEAVSSRDSQNLLRG